jgi:hypothetical protein
MRVPLALAFALSLAACGGGDNNKAQCVEGATQACLLLDGSGGLQVCQASGAWATCQPFAVPDVAAGSDVEGTPDLVPVDIGGDNPDVLAPQDLTIPEDSVVPEDIGLPEDVTLPEETMGTEDGGCVPVCDPLSCGLDGCGGLCNQCLEFAFDDGDTDTAFGYSTAPDPEPTRIACMVRFELPYTNMKLIEFAAGWMYGLYSLQIPFELAWVAGEDVDCELGPEGAWYKEWCSTKADKFVKIGDFLPLEPYDAMDAEMLGEVAFTTQTVFVTAFFDIDEYPIFVCPIDTSGSGKDSFMMSQVDVGLSGPSFEKSAENVGVIPFRIKVSL